MSPADVDAMPWRKAWEYQVYLELIMRLREQQRSKK